MPSIIPFRLAAVCMPVLFVSLFMTLAVTAIAAAKGVPVTVRVVGNGDKVLAEKPLRATTTTIPTSPKATCFGAGTGGTGKPVTLQGPTALGALGQVVKSDPDLRPLLVTDHFSFGIAICGVGGNVVKAGSEGSWYLKVNHKAQAVGGDRVDPVAQLGAEADQADPVPQQRAELADLRRCDPRLRQQVRP